MGAMSTASCSRYSTPHHHHPPPCPPLHGNSASNPFYRQTHVVSKASFQLLSPSRFPTSNGDAREALTGHRVDRSICAWFWEQLLSQPDSFKVFA
ncbi:hypothetical protein E3N88_00428 [Mikania micrantha]|uniref:Uncharacterized protein n=1 Tax=Mikania micrantha TaxID=192012 RepID=A0A5N6PYF1_9ASTR|nr:hypothetical protein E3N88_00428 [Mikania micrantha]